MARASTATLRCMSRSLQVLTPGGRTRHASSDQVLRVEAPPQWVCIRQDGRWCLRRCTNALTTLRDARVSKPSDWVSQLSSTVSSSSSYDLRVAVVESCPSPRLYVDGIFWTEQSRNTARLGSIGIYTAQLYRFKISQWERCFFSSLNWLNLYWSKMYISKN